MSVTVVKAVRKSVPMLISLSGTSGSGKTFSGLLLAAGIAGKEGKVGMIDTENGRGTLYADDPTIMRALPNGYDYVALSAPYSPAAYIEALKALEQAGCNVAIIDSTSHEWEGTGGCCDIADNNKLKGMPNWIMAKREHRRFQTYALSSTMHIIFCLRAREKVKVVKTAKGEAFESAGIQPIAEKNFVFEMLISLMFDGNEGTPGHHRYAGIKVPGMLADVFPGGELITPRHGEMIRAWADGGKLKTAPGELLLVRARGIAEEGTEAYKAFYLALSGQQKRELADHHEALKDTAKARDDERALAEASEAELTGAQA